MTDPLDVHGEALRRALHTEADAVVPSAYGLVAIRARTSQRADRRSRWLLAVLLLALLFTLGES